MEYRKLKSENTELKRILGMVMLELERKKKIEIINKSNNKKLIASVCKINHKNIYYQLKQEAKDQELIKQIEQLHKRHPAYGYLRIAMHLKINKKRSQRVMSKYNIRPPRRRTRRFTTTKSVAHTTYTNILKDVAITRPYQALCSDLTYIKYQGKFVYLGTVQDIFTRQILAVDISDRHDSMLALSIIREALEKTNESTKILHSDQGNEYMAKIVTNYIESKGVKVSVSDKGSPWQNGYKESFYSRFKEENGDLGRFQNLGELIEEVYSYVDYYNTHRIHTKLKMSPLQFKLNFVETGLEKIKFVFLFFKKCLGKKSNSDF